MPISTLVIMQLIQIPAAALFNSLLTVGEETGWRGFLLPALRPLGT
jgi:membrane protease YdiL (CAAX protease family)